MRTYLVLALFFLCMTPAAFSQNVKTTEPLINNPVAVCTTERDEDCARRDTARLFLMAGKTEVALRILCNTNAAMSAFRPNGALDNDKSYTGLGACLKAIGLGRPETEAH
ncbi:MAG TPA: hypothetical protein VGS27_02560 [Candidatus Sulfotelmatobacter sp.]|nr:hypothetical protein [Candidatus Sulfotelmatobacter sp.]